MCEHDSVIAVGMTVVPAAGETVVIAVDMLLLFMRLKDRP